MTAVALPFRRRVIGGGGGAGGSGSDTFCLLGRRVERALAGSGSATGLGSRAGALRFLDGGGRIGGAAGGAKAAEVGEGSDESAACRADARVLLGDMSIWLCNIALNLYHLSMTTRSVMRVEVDRAPLLKLK
jgi:hypothetical protein